MSAEQSKDLRGKEWYYGAISRAECDALFGERGVDGDFLIRDSETNVRRSAELWDHSFMWVWMLLFRKLVPK